MSESNQIEITVGNLTAETTFPSSSCAEEWHDLWLRYTPVADTGLQENYRHHATEVVVEGETPIAASLRAELREGLSGLLAVDVPVSTQPGRAGAVVAGSPDTSPLVAALGWEDELAGLGPEGFVIRSAQINGHPVTVIAGGGEWGALFGAFRYLRQRHCAGQKRSA